MSRVDSTQGGPLTLDEAIKRLEDGTWSDELSVEVTSGVVLTSSGPLGAAGLLQRLRGHARLLALRSGAIAPPEPLHDRKPVLRNDVKAMLDAVRQAR